MSKIPPLGSALPSMGITGGAGDIGKTHACCLADVPDVEDLTLIPSVAVGSRAVSAPDRAQYATFQASIHVRGPSLGQHAPFLRPKSGVEDEGRAGLGLPRELGTSHWASENDQTCLLEQPRQGAGSPTGGQCSSGPSLAFALICCSPSHPSSFHAWLSSVLSS